MRAMRYHEHGNEDVLTLEEIPDPVPGHGEVAVAVRAASVNPIDTYVRDGDVPPPGGLPHIGGADMAGIVDDVGDGVDAFEPGDRVFATGLGLFQEGTYAERAVVPADRVAILPDTVPFVDGAAAAMAFATAWLSLVRRGNLAVGETCLVQGAAGGVGHAAVQVANHAGATVVGTATEGDSAEFARRSGADVVVDYRSDDLASTVGESLRGGAVDVVLETHAASNIVADLELLSPGGRIVVIGEEGTVTLSPTIAMTAKVADADLRFTSIVASAGEQASMLETVGQLLADGTFEVAIAETYTLADTPAAQRHAMASGTLGKVVVEVDR